MRTPQSRLLIVNTISTGSHVQQKYRNLQYLKKNAASETCRVPEKVSLGTRPYRSATIATNAAANAASAVKPAAAASANPAAGTGVRTAIVVITGTNIDPARSKTKTATANTMTTAIVPVIKWLDVNRSQAFNRCLCNRGLRKVAGRYRCCLCSCHRNQSGKCCQSDCEEEFFHFQAPKFSDFLAYPRQDYPRISCLSRAFLNFVNGAGATWRCNGAATGS